MTDSLSNDMTVGPHGAGWFAGQRTDAAALPDTTVSAPSSSDHAHPASATLAGWSRFALIEPVGQGGCGVVHKARDLQFDRLVAVKCLRPDNRNRFEWQERFLAEARITAQLQHPGIVAVHEVGITDDESPFYAMRLFEGRTLSSSIQETHRQLAKGPKVRPAQVRAALLPILSRLISVCHAVAFAHERGIIHRDLKPDNVMIGTFGETIVVDWGLAKSIKETHEPSTFASVERPGPIVGTPHYMAPEQTVGDSNQVDHRADIHAIGAMLYEVISGHHAYRGSTVGEVLANTRAGKLPPPRELCDYTPRALEAICMRALSAAPDDRYQSAIAIAEDMERYIAGEKVSCHDEPWVDRAQRWGRQHQTTAVAILGSLSAAVLLSLVAAVLIDQERREERSARLQIENAWSDELQDLSDSRKAIDQWIRDVDRVHIEAPAVVELKDRLINDAIVRYQGLIRELDEKDMPATISANRWYWHRQLESARCRVMLAELLARESRLEEAGERLSQAEELLKSLRPTEEADHAAFVEVRQYLDKVRQQCQTGT